jgi:hypothetical protein
MGNSRRDDMSDETRREDGPSALEWQRRALVAEAERDEMLLVLRRAAKWCHVGHGAYPIKQCGLCKPVVEVIATVEAQS